MTINMNSADHWFNKFLFMIIHLAHSFFGWGKQQKLFVIYLLYLV